MTYETFRTNWNYYIAFKSPAVAEMQSRAMKYYGLSIEDLYNMYNNCCNQDFTSLYLTLDVLSMNLYDKDLVKNNLKLPKPHSLITTKEEAGKIYYEEPVNRRTKEVFVKYAKHCADTIAPKVQEDIDKFLSKE